MSISRKEIDDLINQHYTFEASDDIEGVLGTMAPEIEHRLLPSLSGAVEGHEAARKFYRNLFASLKGESVTPVRRLHGEEFAVDEVIWHGHVTDGAVFLCPGKTGHVSFNMLHLFEFSGNKIKREHVWCDLAAIQQQLGATPT